VQFVATPDVKVLNGLAADWAQNALYATDSNADTVWKISFKTGTASLWAQGAYLEPSTGQGPIGANGIKVHDGAVWVSNTSQGTLLRIAIGAHGTAGAVTTVAEDLPAIDDFAFTGDGSTVIAALDHTDEVAIVYPDGSHHIVLTAADGLSDPTSIAVRRSAVYVPSGAYFTHVDPNLLVAKLG
jgi:DNA-binding beta-propeller fold protein YncE